MNDDRDVITRIVESRQDVLQEGLREDRPSEAKLPISKMDREEQSGLANARALLPIGSCFGPCPPFFDSK